MSDTGGTGWSRFTVLVQTDSAVAESLRRERHFSLSHQVEEGAAVPPYEPRDGDVLRDPDTGSLIVFFYGRAWQFGGDGHYLRPESLDPDDWAQERVKVTFGSTLLVHRAEATE
ncbi:MAG: hypothetical protein ACRCSN_19810 [Dermatophilaceae bacterium]